MTDVTDLTRAAAGAAAAAGEAAPAGLLAAATAELELKPALEAVLMVVDEPATEEHLAKVLGGLGGRSARRSASCPTTTPARAGALTCGWSLAAGASTPGRPSRRQWRASCWTASRPG